ncbi:hypothetical protein [Thermomonospora umbrina]|nr:hypothetical protein [Thermomonospora umbrina]
MTDSPRDRVATYLARQRALYVPSVITEAGELLADLLAVAERHGVPPTAEAAGWLVTAAAESVSERHGRRPEPERTAAQARPLIDALTSECVRRGLTTAPARHGGGWDVAVEPVPGGRTWGPARTGLVVRIYADADWHVMVDQRRTRTFTIYAPATPAGAIEVAALLDDIMRGHATNPFADRPI